MDHDERVAHRLDEALGVQAVALLLDVPEVFGVCLAVGQALLMAVQHDVVWPDALRNVFAPLQRHGLADGILAHQPAEVVGGAYRLLPSVQQPLLQGAAEVGQGQLAHTIYNKVCPTVGEDGGAQAVLPVVIVRHAA